MTLSEQQNLTDVAAERIVLSGIFRYGYDAYIDIVELLQIDTFTDSINQIIFKCLKHAFDKKELTEVDIPTIIGISNELFLCSLESPTKLKYLSIISATYVALSNVKMWASKIRRLHIARLLKGQLEQANVDLNKLTGDEPVAEILGLAEDRIFNFSSLIENDDDEPQLLSEGLGEYVDYIEENPTSAVGISSGYKYYDWSIGGGFRRGIISLVSARIKEGKTMFATNIALHVTQNLNIPVLYIDTEMMKEDHWSRLLSNLCFHKKITINEIESGKYISNKSKCVAIREAQKILEQKKLFWYKNVANKDFEEVLSLIRRWIYKEVGFDENGNVNNCLIIYDHFHLSNPDKLRSSLQEYQLLGFMIVSLKNLAIRYKVPIFCVAQSNREGIDKETTAVLAGSDRVLWTVANFSLWREKSEKDLAEVGEEYGNNKLIPLFARHGEGLKFGDYINYFYHKKFCKIEEGETRNNVLAKQKEKSEEEKEFDNINKMLNEADIEE